MQESISGFKIQGDWGDVVEHGERITHALNEVGIDSDAFDDWDDWRPKSHERIDTDVSEKTASQASVGEGAGEQAGKKPGEDLQKAGEKLSESKRNVENGDGEAALENVGESVGKVARAADSVGRKAIRKVEDTVYQKVMTQLAPYYFDNELISANIQRTSGGEDGEEFVFEVNINDDELKDEAGEVLADYEERVERWHVDAEKETETAEAAEGVETPREPDETKSTTT